MERKRGRVAGSLAAVAQVEVGLCELLYGHVESAR